MVQTDAKGETGATMERMGEEEGIVPERSEWFRSSGIIGTALAGGKLGKGRIVTCLPWSSPAASAELGGSAKTPRVVVRYAAVIVRGWRVSLRGLA